MNLKQTRDTKIYFNSIRVEIVIPSSTPLNAFVLQCEQGPGSKATDFQNCGR